MDKMPQYKEGFITLWRDGKWVQVKESEMSKIIEEDNSGTQNSSELPAGA